MPNANYRCDECSHEEEFLFDGPPPAVHSAPHEGPPGDDGVNDACTGRFTRRWAGSAPSIGTRNGNSPSKGSL